MNNEIPADVMFYVGAQEDSDGDLLASSFTVFYTGVPQSAAMEIIIHKIAHDIEGLGLDEAEGTVSLHGIRTWQEFADIPLDDDVKTVALLEAMTSSAIIIVHDVRDQLTEALKMRWVKTQ
jgi:hypothetical protein